MKKPKIYINKDGRVTIVFGKDFTDKECHVLVVHDRGIKISKETNIFGSKLYRFVYHHATAYGDSGHCSAIDKFPDSFGKKYKLVEVKE